MLAFRRVPEGADVDFNVDFSTYETGFGDALVLYMCVRRQDECWTNAYVHVASFIQTSYWLGLEKLHALTTPGGTELLVVLEGCDGGTANAKYGRFLVRSQLFMYGSTRVVTYYP